MPQLMEEETSQFESNTVGVFRTAATVKGGRRFSFSALVIVGDRNGRVGWGYGKSVDVPSAIAKGEKKARRAIVKVGMTGNTIHHEVEGRFGSARVRLLPASPGTGVVAGATVRAVLEMAGLTDCLTKNIGSTNKINTVKAVFDGLQRLRAPQVVAELRGVDLGSTVIEDKIARGRKYMPETTGERAAKGPVNTVGDQRSKGGGRGGRGGRGGGRGGDRRPAHGGDAPPAAPAAAPEQPPAAAEAPASPEPKSE
jgi:small subunit ribosomal protein S5